MHNPTGLTPNIKIKTVLTPVGVDAGVMLFEFDSSNDVIRLCGAKPRLYTQKRSLRHVHFETDKRMMCHHFFSHTKGRD